MSKKIPLGIAISLIAIATAVTFILTSSFSLKMFNKEVQDVKERAEVYKKLDQIDTYVRENYIGSVDNNAILDAISEGYMQVLDDKYARYLSVDASKIKKSEDEGVFVGVGISVEADDSGYFVISDVKVGSPAQQAGLLAGQQIVAVNGESIITLGYDKSITEFYGDAGTNLSLTIRVDGVDKEFVLTRAEIKIDSVTSKMIGEIGYIKITEFNTKTLEQFNAAIASITEAKAKGIVFDLRNNGGGLLSPTLAMLDKLLPQGEIATATYKDGTVSVLGTSDANEVDLPMTVLVNSRTASAAELFSSALRDFEKATLIGANTFGKGIMQNTYELSDGSSIIFTVATYKTSKTPNFDGVGLKPNYEVIMKNDTPADLALLDETTDTQLKKALEVLKSNLK